MQTFILFFATIISIFILDMIWLGYLAKQLYMDNIGNLLRKSAGMMTPIWPAAIMVYICIASGIIFFVLPKANGNYQQALVAGMLFGAVTYGIYDFTNYAILADWSFKITIIDFFWGMVLCGLGSVIVTFIQNRFFHYI